MRKALLFVALTLFVTPSLVKAGIFDDWRHRDPYRDPKPHQSVHADQLIGFGVGGAAMVGLAGYFLLRKRNATA